MGSDEGTSSRTGGDPRPGRGGDRTTGELFAGVVATQYRDQRGRTVHVAPDAVAAVTAAAGNAVPVIDQPVQRPAPVPETRRWGWQLQLYQLRSAESWAIGDYADLATLARGLGALGADLLLVNPLHAETPVAPFTDSPYFPSSRRFVSLLSLSIPSLPEYRDADPDTRRTVDALRPKHHALIDRDEVWRAKLAALDLLFPGEDAVTQLLTDYGDVEALRHFAAFCALAERFGRSWADWPTELRAPGPRAFAAADPRRVALHVWAQLRAREQLRAAQDAAL